MRTNEIHAHTKQVQRSSGRSSVAAAAYRSAERLIDERTGLVHDYTDKRGVEHSRIYTPENAPDWSRDRSALWNNAEMRETKSNAATAHELVVGFPHEFDPMQRREAGDAIAREIMERYNVAVDINYHQPSRKGDERNFHAHILFTTRSFDASRPDGWARTKFRDLAHDRTDKITGQKYFDHAGNATSRGALEVESLRKFSADEMNRIAERDRLAVRTEYLSFERRGIDREPTQKMGAEATKMEREGKASDRGDMNRAIDAANDNRALLNKAKQEFVNDATMQQREAMLAHVASEHRFYEFHKTNAARAEANVQSARERLDAATWLDGLRGTKKQLQNDLQAKQDHLADARQRMHELVDSKTRAEIERSDYARLLSQPHLKMEHDIEMQREQRMRQHQEELSERQSIEFERVSRTNAERIMDAITGKARDQELRLEILRENALSHQAQERQFQEFKAQEQADKIQTQQRELDREYRSAREVRGGLEQSERQHWAGAAAPTDSRDYQQFSNRQAQLDRSAFGRAFAAQENATFWSGADKPARGYSTMTEREALDARQAQFDGMHEEQGRAANDMRDEEKRLDRPADFDRAAEMHSAGERVADASHGFEGGEGGGQPDGDDHWKMER